MSARAHAEGLPHEGFESPFKGKRHRISIPPALTGLQLRHGLRPDRGDEDRMDARAAAGLTTIYEATNAECTTLTEPHRASRMRHG